MFNANFILRRFLKRFGVVAVSIMLAAFPITAARCLAHPGSGIVTDSRGCVHYTHTVQGIWKIDALGIVTSYPNPAHHGMNIDLLDRLVRPPLPGFVEPSTTIRRVSATPTGVLSIDSPLMVNRDGSSHFVFQSLHIAGNDRRDWIPSVRRLEPTREKRLAAIERSNQGESRAIRSPAVAQPQSFTGSVAGAERIVEGVELRWCPPGKFRMGSPPDEPGRRPDESPVEVTLAQGFWMGRYEVTQAQWKRILGNLPTPLNAGEGDDFPIYWVSYLEAEEFCRTITQRAHASGAMPENWEFRLPTEAQWEYACRAGTGTAFSFGATLSSQQANINKPYRGAATGVPSSAATRVGSFEPNAWGLHDMHGNEFEWCRDWYHERLPGGSNPDLSQVKGLPNRDGSFSRVRRGGAWMDSPTFCRSALRLRYEPERKSDHIGFRVAVLQR